MKRNYFLIIVFIFLSAIVARSQTDAFTYQGRLTDSMSSGSGSYLMKFELFSDAAGNNLVDVLTDVPVSVSNNIFTVNLNFTAANAFDGGNRFLKISVKRNANETYTPLNPLQPITSTPYSIKAKNATTATNALNVGGTPAAQIVKDDDVRLTDSRNPLAGSSNYVQNTATQQIGTTNFNISGIGAANSFNAATGFSIGGSRVLRVGNSADNNLFVGLNAGASQNLTGSDNAFVGAGAGQNNTTGGGNAFFGSAAGETNTTGGGNTFVGREAGRYSTGADNTFIGSGAGYNNSTGSKNTALGENAQVGGGLTFATVIGAGATVSDSNSVVLGRGGDTVRIPGNLNLTGTFSGNFTVPASNVTGTFSQTQIPNLDAGKITSGTLDAARIPNLGASYIQNTTTQQTGNFNLSGNGTLGGTLSGGTVNAQTGFNIGGARVLSVAGTNNAFAGINA
ncbi:MAG TPA: hypothetical protein VK308_07695, partial [Pyrinomonadaceae bacterium]|nr:hypothetical protein [Pyrinomonadaceae bacterium]